jgi:hypothetical protein
LIRDVGIGVVDLMVMMDFGLEIATVVVDELLLVLKLVIIDVGLDLR